MKGRLILAAVVIPLGIIIAAVPENTTKPYKLTAEELLSEVKEGTQFMTPDAVAQLMVEKDPSLQLIDVRSSHEFEKFSLPGAINIPLENLLSAEYEDILNQDVKVNVFYSNSSNVANQAWMITRQLGYQNNYVLEGGLNYWAETIMNPQKPAATSPSEEMARYNFRQGASAALGGASVEQAAAPESKAAAVPAVKAQKKKKSVQGGC